MTNLDELSKKWAEHDRKLDTIVRLNRQLFAATKLGRARSALRRLATFQAVGLLINFVPIVLLGSFLGDHIRQIRFVLPAAVLHLAAIAILVAGIQQVRLALQIDYGKPVTAIQKQIETLRLLRTRTTQWILLASPLLWTPLLIVALEGFWGVDAYRVLGVAYLAANLLFGAAIIPVAILLSKKFGGGVKRSPIVQRLMKDLGGYNLNAAAGSLARLSEFEAEFEREPRDEGHES